MDPEEFQTPISPEDPLAQMGLVDFRTGRATQLQDQPPSSDATRQDGGGTSSATSSGLSDSEDGEPASTEAPSPRSEWDSDENPYKARALTAEEAAKRVPDPAAQARQGYESKVQQLNTERQAAYSILTTQGLDGTPMPPALAQTMVDSLHRAAVAEARLEADRAVLMPTAKTAVATDIAKKYSVGGVKIESSELIDLATPEAMDAKAQALQQGRRDANFQNRRAGGRDRAESGAPAGASTSRLLEGLSPQQRISYGLRRGDLDRP